MYRVCWVVTELLVYILPRGDLCHLVGIEGAFYNLNGYLNKSGDGSEPTDWGNLNTTYAIWQPPKICCSLLYYGIIFMGRLSAAIWAPPFNSGANADLASVISDVAVV